MNWQPTALVLSLVLSCMGAAMAPVDAAVAQSQIKNAPVCGDFLARIQKKPAHVVFDKCTSEPARQGKPLRALYHVRGLYAVRVEAALIKSTGLNKLKRSCCQWDSPTVQFKSAKGQEYSISMVSPETTIAKRTQWRKIPKFEIAVDLMTEEI
jgi:hypothetical protein